MNKEIKNKYGIKIDDIFYLISPCGRNGSSVNFFQVVDLKGTTKVILREVEIKKVSSNGNEGDFVVPNKNHFVENSSYIEYNNIGAVKISNKDSDNKINVTFNIYYNRNPFDERYFKHSMFDYAYLWDGQPLIHYIDYMD